MCIRLAIVLALIVIAHPINAGSDACAAIEGWSGTLGVGTGAGSVAQWDHPTPFAIGEQVIVHVSGFEAGITIEIPTGHVVAHYPFFFGYPNETFRYNVSNADISSVKISLTGYSLNYWVNCVSAAQEDKATTVVPPDSRLNWQHGDLLAVIYPSMGEANQPVLDVYAVMENSQGTFVCRLTEAEVATTQQDKNLFLKSCGDFVSIYLLMTGEIQFNIGPDAQGKIQVIIFDGIPVEKTYSYSFEIGMPIE